MTYKEGGNVWEGPSGERYRGFDQFRKYRARKREKRVMNRDRKRRYRRKQRKKKELRFKETWKEILKKSEEIAREEPQDHSLMDNTEAEWDQNKLDLIHKGQKCA